MLQLLGEKMLKMTTLTCIHLQTLPYKYFVSSLVGVISQCYYEAKLSCPAISCHYRALSAALGALGALGRPRPPSAALGSPRPLSASLGSPRPPSVALDVRTSLQTSIVPNTTWRPSKKLSPTMITVVPPVVHPSLGQIALMVGVAAHRKPATGVSRDMHWHGHVPTWRCPT